MKNLRSWLIAGIVVCFGLISNQTLAQCSGCPDLASRTAVTITDSGSGTGTTTWTCDNTYFLDGYVFVNSGQVLTIEPGTVIKGNPGSGASASALIVARGGQIIADGTIDCPIIFTYAADPLDGSVSYDTRGQWGGLLVLGDAPINLAGGEGQAEGIPADNDRAKYGGSNASDNSGVLRFVSVRHGGTTLAAANEINGITLAGVGSSTIVDYVEVISNADDGIEFFGGSVDVKHAAVAFCDDDSFDWDQGYNGNGQFWFVLQDQPNTLGDRGGELDGDDLEEGDTDGVPVSNPTVYNATFMGEGTNNGAILRNGSAGTIANSIFTNFGEGIEIEDKDTFDAYDNIDFATPANGDLQLIDNCFWNISGMDIDYDGSLGAGQANLDAWFAAQGNDGSTDPGLDDAYAVNGTGLVATDPVGVRPATNLSANSAVGAFFSSAAYKGAFDAGQDIWLSEWTFLDERGFIADTGLSGSTSTAASDGAACGCPPIASRTTVNISDAGAGTGTTTWTCDNTYVLSGPVFVNNGDILTVEPGTVIKGAPGSGASAAALIVARGGQINANGSADCPIIMTFEADPLDGSTPAYTFGQWGGFLVLGDAPINLAGGEGQVEGIPATNDRAKYGGTDEQDNSGVIRYVSVRHGGTTLAAANEINGITLAGVGRGTTVEYIEVVSNSDDGIEFFGGTVDVRYASVFGADDDSFDWDQGYSGRGQYWVAIQDQTNTGGDRGGELDGDDLEEGDTDGVPVSNPIVYNMTFIGEGTNNGAILRNGSAGTIANSIFANFGEGIEIEDKDAFDAWDNIDFGTPSNGDLQLINNCFWNIAGQDIDYDGSLANGQTDLDAWFAAQGNASADPGIDYTYALNGTDLIAVDQLDVIPTNSGTVTAAADAFFDAALYKGAFAPGAEVWVNNWSFLDERNIIGVTGCGDFAACNYDPSADAFDNSLCAYPGDACDDGDAATSNDVYTTDCGCAGEILNTGAGCDCPPLADRTEVTIVDNGSGVGTATWTCDNTYILQGYCFVNDGQVLTIDAGTVVKGGPGSGASASALIVARGGAIDAQGAADCPIIFTFEADPLDGSTPFNTRGQWGGVVVLGDAPINLAGGEGQIEGVPATNDRAKYGGSNPLDNSGIMTYCSIRHGGTQLAAANEINGLTLGGVGSGTQIDHIEVISNADDGIEFFGGSVSVNYAVVGFADDDSFDWDQGYNGDNQFWFVLQDQTGGSGDRGGELDGDDIEEGDTDGTPVSNPTVWNATFIGEGTNNGAILRNGSAGKISNSIFSNFGEGVEIEDKDAVDAYDFVDVATPANGELQLNDNCFFNISGQTIDYDGSDASGQSNLDSWFAASGNGTVDTGIDDAYSVDGSGIVVTATCNPVPSQNFTATAPMAPFESAAYKGAFDPASDNWMVGWTFIEGRGFFSVTGCTDATACNYNPDADVSDNALCTFPGDACDDGNDNTTGDVLDGDCNCAGTDNTNTGADCGCPPLSARTEVTISDAGAGTGTATWTCDNTYILDGYVFVNSGQALTIEEGTVVKGAPGSGASASALIVARGGEIFANGSATCPITFTFQADPLDGSTPAYTQGQWGGVIILGDAPINLAGGEGQIEGVPADNDRAKYGGSNANDNSGVFTYCSIRHGGTTLAAANEINGLTLGGVGAGTTIDYVEVVSNADDGIEMFGGTVGIQHAAVAFCDDDQFDYDQGWTSTDNQFWFVIQDQDNQTGDRGGEYDGDDLEEGDTDGTPVSDPTIANQTSIGEGTNNGLIYRNGANGTTTASIFLNWGEGVEIEDKDAYDAYDGLVAGDLTLVDNCWWAIGGNTAADVIDYDGSDANGQAFVETVFGANGNDIADPGVDYNYALNLAGTVALDKLDITPSADVTTTSGAGYKGCIDPSTGTNWMNGWTYIANTLELFAITGCTDATACNYDAAATQDDGSCEYPGDACDDNDPLTTDDVLQGDCSCAGEVVNGCTDGTACNYDAAATVDDGSCEFTTCAGCTDAAACNYDATATIDNGECDYLVTFQVNMAQETVSGSGVSVRIFEADQVTFTDYPMTASGQIYSATVCTGSAEYLFVNGTAPEFVPVECGVPSGSGGFNRAVTVTMDMTVGLVCFELCTACPGCTDPEFLEFDPYADIDDGSCATAVVAGCTYDAADNYDATANVDDGSCTGFGVANDCPEDLNGDGSIGTADILSLLGAFGTDCD